MTPFLPWFIVKVIEMKKWAKFTCGALTGLMLASSVAGASCKPNEVERYVKELNLPEQNRAIIGQLEYDANTKALLDEISYLLGEIQVSERVLNDLKNIAADKKVTNEELVKFGDLDGDGLSNQEELKYKTDLLNPDTDNDGLNDREETLAYRTNPLNFDSDKDGLRDGKEVLTYKTNPLEPDTDKDGLNDREEVLAYRTDPLNPDSDRDGLKDGEEVLTHKTNPRKPDTDNDGLDDGEEVLVYGTNPLREDSDNDRFTDEEEILVFKSDPLDKNDPLNLDLKPYEDSDGDGVMDCDDLEPYKENSYKETVSWLSREMKRDALSCICQEDKVKTFENLCHKVLKNVPHAKGRGWGKYPNAKWDASDDWCKHPRDILMNYYTYHRKVQLPPDCDDVSCVYDIMADYIIERTGWDEEGEETGNSGVDCDVFTCIAHGGHHIVCIVNINGEEYAVDPSTGGFLELSLYSRSGLKFPWDKGYTRRNIIPKILMVKFDKRYTDSIFNKKCRYIRVNVSRGSFWEMLRNQTPENEKKLEMLYLKVRPSD